MSEFIHITDLTIPELDIYARLNEAGLYHYYEPRRGIFIAESPKVITRALDAGCEPISFLMEEKQAMGEAAQVLERCSSKNVPVFIAPEDVLKKFTGYPMTRGALCAMRRPILRSVQEICTGAGRIAVLENVVNPTNVGAIFRSAAALGMDAVLLTAGCSDPLQRRASRVSMGTVFQIPWTYLGKRSADWPHPAMELLREMGFQTAAMALRGDSISIDAPQLRQLGKLAIVLGTEGDGLAAETIADCDFSVRIPMTHRVDSLNVAAASAVAFWELTK